MGWCYEFGAQIHEGCGAPMVAAAASCACAQCGTVCPGRFSSCRDVWVRGPQQFTVVTPPAVPGQLAANNMSQNGKAPEHASHAPSADIQTMVSETSEAVAAGRLAVRVENRLAQMETRLGALEALAAYVQALRGTLKTDLARLTSEVAESSGAVQQHDERLTALESRAAAVGTLPARVDSLSREVFDAVRSTDVKERFDALEEALATANGLASRVAALELGRASSRMWPSAGPPASSPSSPSSPDWTASPSVADPASPSVAGPAAPTGPPDSPMAQDSQDDVSTGAEEPGPQSEDGPASA